MGKARSLGSQLCYDYGEIANKLALEVMNDHDLILSKHISSWPQFTAVCYSQKQTLKKVETVQVSNSDDESNIQTAAIIIMDTLNSMFEGDTKVETVQASKGNTKVETVQASKPDQKSITQTIMNAFNSMFNGDTNK